MESLQALATISPYYVAAAVFLAVFAGRAILAGIKNLSRFVNFVYYTLVWTLGALVLLGTAMGITVLVEKGQQGAAPPSPDSTPWVAEAWRLYARWA